MRPIPEGITQTIITLDVIVNNFFDGIENLTVQCIRHGPTRMRMDYAGTTSGRTVANCHGEFIHV